jgi:hypothetical protein
MSALGTFHVNGSMSALPPANLGGDALALSPADFGKLIGDETEKWATSSGPSTSRRSEADPPSIFHKSRDFGEANVRFGPCVDGAMARTF